MSEKIEGRANGLNNKGFPLRKIVGTTETEHVLECGHFVPPVSKAHVRWRRCPVCAGQDARTPEQKRIAKLEAKTKVYEGIIQYALDAPDDAKAIKTILFDILNGFDIQTDIDEFRKTHGKYGEMPEAKQ